MLHRLRVLLWPWHWIMWRRLPWIVWLPLQMPQVMRIWNHWLIQSSRMLLLLLFLFFADIWTNDKHGNQHFLPKWLSKFCSALALYDSLLLTHYQSQHGYMFASLFFQHMDTVQDIPTRVCIMDVVCYMYNKQSKKAVVGTRAAEAISSLIRYLIASADVIVFQIY